MRLDLFFILFIAGINTLTFTPSTSPNVTNYTVYYGPTSRLVTNRVQIGLATSWTITNVPPSTVAFLFATSWAGGQESDPSNEILFTNAAMIRLAMFLERAWVPDGPYVPVTNVLTYTATVEPHQFYRVRMEASTLP